MSRGHQSSLEYGIELQKRKEKAERQQKEEARKRKKAEGRLNAAWHGSSTWQSRADLATNRARDAEARLHRANQARRAQEDRTAEIAAKTVLVCVGVLIAGFVLSR